LFLCPLYVRGDCGDRDRNLRYLLQGPDPANHEVAHVRKPCYDCRSTLNGHHSASRIPFHLVTSSTMQCPVDCSKRYEPIRRRATRCDAGSHSLLFPLQQPMKCWMIGSPSKTYNCLVWVVIRRRCDMMLLGCVQQAL
jgi:hypothetical protein